jgi:PPOX class probable F420-dependent enzyme
MLEAKNFGTLCTLMPNGSPQATVVWVDTDGEYVLINTSEGRQKTNNVQRSPRVALSVHDEENPYRQLQIRGRIMEVTTEGAVEHIDKLAKKYRGVDKYTLRAGEQRVILKIRPDHVSGSGA